MDLPFTNFRLSIPPQFGYGSVCRVIKVLDEVVINGISQPLLLIRIASIAMDYFWTAVFNYEEGIGGRTIMDANHIKLIHFVGTSGNIDETRAAANSKEIINIRWDFHATSIEIIE